MNEKIRELIKLSYVVVPHERDWDATSSVFDKEKFAKLIINECTLMLDSITVPVFESYEDFDRGYNKGLETGITVIKNRFGIE